jgi:hypothetical protein
MAATTGDLLISGRNGRHIYAIALAVRIQYFLDSLQIFRRKSNRRSSLALVAQNRSAAYALLIPKNILGPFRLKKRRTKTRLPNGGYPDAATRGACSADQA